MRRRVALLLIVAAATVVPAAAAVIVPQHSIAGVRLGMTEKKVRALLGKPLAVKVSQNDFGTFRQLVYAQVSVGFQSGPKVTGMTTTSPKERTAAGVGVGSTVAQLRAALRGETCRKEFGVFHCWLGAFDPGKVVTDFFVRGGRVSRVTLGYVID
jgi:hypothetical protein